MSSEALPAIALTRDALTQRVLFSCLQGLAPASRRVYSALIARCMVFLNGSDLTRESVRAWLRSLELSGSSPQVRNQALAAVKRFTTEAAELGWMDAAESARVSSVRSVRSSGTRSGQWLTEPRLAQLLTLPDRGTMMGRRDAALLALLIGCGLRRAEACRLTCSHVRTIDGRMYLADIHGKGGRVRTIAVPESVAGLIAQWCACEVGWSGLIMRSFNADGTINGSLSDGAVRDIVRHYGARIGVSDLNPHDLRRSLARAARKRGAPLETIQHTLGHASVRTTELYTRTGEEANAGDFLRLG